MKRFVIFLSMIATVFAFAGCSSSDDDDNSGFSDKFMFVGDSAKVGTQVTVDNRFVGYVSKNGYLHAFHVGETTYGTNGNKATLKVEGQYNAFNNVVTDWGISPATLKSKISATPTIDEAANDGTYMVAYKNQGCANIISYGFKNNKLYIVMALSNPSDEDEILNYLKERYVFLPEEVQSYTWGGADALDEDKIKTLVLLKLDSSFKLDYMLQTYFESKELSSNSSSSKVMKKVMNRSVSAFLMK